MVEVALKQLPDVSTVTKLSMKQRVQLFEMSGRNKVLVRLMPFDYWPAVKMVDLDDLGVLDQMLKLELGEVLNDNYIGLL